MASQTWSDPPIDPVLQLHRGFEEQQQQSQQQHDQQQHEQQHEQQQQLPALPTDQHPGVDYGQGHYPPPPLDGSSNQQINERNGFRPHQDPRPIIPPDVDTSRVDLTYRRNPRSNSANNPGPDGWLYPHKKGIGTGSNLEAFKEEIEARTLRGENCKAISAALNEMGVQTSDKAISRVRIKWGMRKRSQRKIKTPPPDSDAARLTAKTKVQTLRKIEIRRMTQEGMTAEQIYENLTSRGMELKKGVATVLRLQSAWKLTTNPKRWLENFRHQCHKKAKAEQIQAFKDIAKEMVLEDFDAWLEAKLAEEQVREARHELAIKLMGEHAPTVNRRKLQARRGEAQANNDADEGENEEEEDWQEALSNPDPESKPDVGHNADAGPSSETAPNEQAAAVFEPIETRTDPALMADDANPDSAENVALRAFAQTVSPPAAAPTPVPAKSRQAKAAKRGKGRKGKQSAGKAASKSAPIAPMHGAPEAQMTANDASALQGVDVTMQDAPALVLRPEEAEANRSTLSTLDQYRIAAETYQQVLQARTDNKPIPGSLTGLPPSSKEVEAAKRRLKDVTSAMMLNLD